MNGTPYWQVEAFADRPGAGNPAGVFLLDSWPGDEWLQSAAAKLKLPATAFLVPSDAVDVDYEICWFSPKSEIALCGHASLASGHVLLERDGGAYVRLQTRRAGIVEVRRNGEGYELALPAIATGPCDFPEAVALLGGEPIEVRGNNTRHSIFLYSDEARIRSLEPNFAGLAKLGNDQFICTAPGERTDIVSRVFVPGIGANEDSVTGSAHAALAPFWAGKLGRNAFAAHQASPRGGDLAVRLEGNRVWLGGQCVTVS